MKRLFGKGIKLWESELSLRIFFLSIIVLNFILTPLATSHHSGTFIARTFYLFLIVSGSYALIKNKIYTYIIIAFSITAFIVWIVSSDNRIIWLDAADGFMQVLFYLIFLLLILIKVFKGGVFNMMRIEGAMTGYLLIGNLFASLYHTLNIILVNAFNITGASEGIAGFMYFSFTTLTTLGYGDIVPLHPIVRSISNMEAVIGQLYPAVLIARLISLESTNPKE